MRLAILSGTFNPIHKAHIDVAKYVQKEFNYDELLLIPAYNPPFKESCASAFARLEMVKLAAKKSNLKVCDIEFEDEKKSYSYITVKKLYERFPISGKIGFIMGTDAYVNLDKWYEAHKLKELVEFIVFEREIPFSHTSVKLMRDKGFKLIEAKMPFEDISSSLIRKKLEHGERVNQFIEKEVEEYINEHGLYK